MPSIGRWTASPNQWAMNNNDRAYQTERRILQKPTTIVVYRAGTALDEQTVRLDLATSNPMKQVDPNVKDAAIQMLVIGYKGHPEIDNTDLQRGDQFLARDPYDENDEGQLYDVVQVLPETPGALQVIAEVSSS